MKKIPSKITKNKMFYYFLLGCITLLQTSCFSSYVASESVATKPIPQSKFASAESVGMKKEDIIKKFGLPISTSAEQQKNVINEELHYVETLGDIKIVTTIILQDGIAIKQKVDQISSDYDERFKRLDRQIKILQSPRLYN